MKNVEVEDLERGTVLTTDASVKSAKSMKAQASLVRYWQAPMKSEMVVHLGSLDAVHTRKSGSHLR